MPQLHVPARLEQLASVNSFLSENIPPRFLPTLLNLELVTEELLVNVFSYAYPEANALSIPPGEYVRKNETQRN